MTQEKSLRELKQKLHDIRRLEAIDQQLNWDLQVNLPKKAGDARAAQLAVLATCEHQMKTDPALGELLSEAGELELTDSERTIVNEAQREFDRHCRIPEDFARKVARDQAKAYETWVTCRGNDDFKSYEPTLELQLQNVQQEAQFVNFFEDPYDYCLDKHDPGLTKATVAQLFSKLKDELPSLIDAITESAPRSNKERLRNFPKGAQEAFAKEVTAAIGFDYEAGRLDTAVHPFCSGDDSDVRLTTRYYEDDPLCSLYGALHEAGHGLYQQGIPYEDYGTALSMHVGMAVHESQSRIWENQVGRSPQFWQHWETRYRELFKESMEGISSGDFLAATKEVARTPIRVESDEVTYNLHIILRFEIETKLFDGSLEICDLPDYWNSSMQKLLGITPKNDAEGVLQDVHWSVGAFGYFPSYAIGNLIASQLWYTAKEALPSLEENIAQGKYSGFLSWLRKNIHEHGRRYGTEEIVKKATGNPLSVEPHLKYLRERYLEPVMAG